MGICADMGGTRYQKRESGPDTLHRCRTRGCGADRNTHREQGAEVTSSTKGQAPWRERYLVSSLQIKKSHLSRRHQKVAGSCLMHQVSCQVQARSELQTMPTLSIYQKSQKLTKYQTNSNGYHAIPKMSQTNQWPLNKGDQSGCSSAAEYGVKYLKACEHVRVSRASEPSVERFPFLHHNARWHCTTTGVLQATLWHMAEHGREKLP